MCTLNTYFAVEHAKFGWPFKADMTKKYVMYTTKIWSLKLQ